MAKSVLFDLDGTLLNTSEGVISSVKYLVDELELEPLEENEYRTFIGPPVSRRLKELYGMSDADAIAAMKLFRKHYAEGDLFKAIIYDGMEALLKQLQECNFMLGVATYKLESMAQSLLERQGIAKYFDVIHGADEEGIRTKSDVVKLCINDLGSNAADVVMIGDSDNDAEGAALAGTKFIGVTYGFGFKTAADVERFSNIGIAGSCEEIFEILKQG